MYRIALGLSLALVFGFSFVGHSFAQTAPKASAEPAVLGFVREPFSAGESLVYEGKYSRMLLRGIDIADLKFTVEKASPNAAVPANNPNYKFKAEVNSKGALLKLFGVSFIQKMQSTAETRNLQSLQTIRYDEQGKRIRNGEASYDYAAQKVVYREVDPTNPATPPRTITSPLDSPVHDLLSAIYFLRRQPLAIGKTFEIPVSESGVVYRIPVKVTARERLKTVIGKVWTLRLEPEVFGDKRLIPDEGKMVLWLTDDARHLPVRSQIQSRFGKIEIKLRTATGLQSL